jgi:hypothetical protein
MLYISWLYQTCWNNLATSLIISTRLSQVVNSLFQILRVVRSAGEGVPWPWGSPMRIVFFHTLFLSCTGNCNQLILSVKVCCYIDIVYLSIETKPVHSYLLIAYERRSVSKQRKWSSKKVKVHYKIPLGKHGKFSFEASEIRCPWPPWSSTSPPPIIDSLAT